MNETRFRFVSNSDKNSSVFDSLFHLLGNSSYTNATNIMSPQRSATKTELQLYDYLIPVIGGFIIALNFAVVISSGLILKKGQQPRSTYLFLGNVAMTDLITGFAVVFGEVYPKQNRGHYICALQLGMIVASTLTSVYSVGLIAVDRFLYILHGMKYQRWVYPQRARLLIALTWIIGGIVGFLPLMGWYGDTDNGRICWFIIMAPRGLVVLTVLVGIIPLIIVIILYSIILYHAIRKIIQLQEADQQRTNPNNLSPPETGGIRINRAASSPEETIQEEQTTNSSKTKGFFNIFKKKPSSSVKSPNKWKAIKVVLFTTGSFVITWSPYFITSLLFVYNCNKDSNDKKCKMYRVLIASPLAILGFLNSFFNPIIYAWWHKGFRSFVKNKFRILKKKVTGNSVESQQSNSNSQSKNSRKTSNTTSSSSDSNKGQAEKVEVEKM